MFIAHYPFAELYIFFDEWFLQLWILYR